MTAGWFPDPSGQPGQRYYDGQRWTPHFVPTPPPVVAPPPPSVAVAVSSGGGPNHALHAVLTLLTCGLWLPIWILAAIIGAASGSSVAVVGGAGGARVTTRSNRTALIALAGLFVGLVMLGVVVEHPWLLVVLAPMVGAGAFFFWQYRSAQDRRSRELREQYRRDVLADRADYENALWQRGDPRGTYGRYMPPRY